MIETGSENIHYRLFAALPLPESIQETLGESKTLFVDKDSRELRWVAPQNLHLTLRFYGELKHRQVMQLQELLDQSLRDIKAPILRISGTGAFPSEQRPAVLWAGVKVLSGALDPLVHACEAAAVVLGLEENKKRFIPHITLARIRRPKERAKSGGVSRYTFPQSPFGQEFKARNVVLFNSELTPRGPFYTVLKEYELTQ